MANLLDRVLGLLTPDESSLVLPPGSIIAALRERQRGNITQAQINSVLALTASDTTGFNLVFGKLTSSPATLTYEELADLLALGNTRNRASQTGAAYYTKAQIKTRLGL